MAGSGEPNKFLPSEVLGNAKVAAESVQTSLGNQGEKVTAAAGEVKKNVVEYVDKAADYVHCPQSRRRCDCGAWFQPCRRSQPPLCRVRLRRFSTTHVICK
ncbi:hypothetical protein P8452_37159 [Trifolium repens]|nr:hypothetical protein P8452_37159 [Trifolium repens]